MSEEQAANTSDADYVKRFIEHLSDPAVRLRTDAPNDPSMWLTSWGVAGKAAILRALTRDGDA